MIAHDNSPRLENRNSAPVLRVAEAPYQEPADPLANPLLAMHRLLRGRYKWAILLGLIAACAGAVLGYRSQKPIWTSKATIEIRPLVPRILYTTGRNEMMPMFGSYIDAQAALLKSQRTALLAMQNKNWKKLKRPDTPASEQAFESSIRVVHTSGKEDIYLLFSDKVPAAARAGARAVVSAYQQIYGSGDVARENLQMQVLQDHRTILQNDLRGTEAQIAAIANKFGPTALASIFTYKVRMMDKLEAQWQLARLAVLKQGREKPVNGAAGKPLWTVNKISRHDPEMRTLQLQLLDIKRSLESLRLQGLTRRNHAVRKLRAARRAQMDEIRNYAKNYQPIEIPQIGVKPQLPLKKLRARAARLKTLYTTFRQQTLKLGKENQKIAALRRHEKHLRVRLAKINARITAINFESASGGRLNIESHGDRPMVSRDLRLPAAAAGAMGGMSLGFLLVILYGLSNQRFRSARDAVLPQLPAQRILGVVPELPSKRATPVEMAVCAHSVHRIRGLLQVAPDAGNTRVLAVTSPSPGNGKTSLTMALGVSFAASGARTLLIDCDAAGGQLTERMGIPRRRKLGEILLRENAISKDQLKEALASATQSQRRIGAELRSLGYIEPRTLDRALTMQHKSEWGLMDALEGRPMDRCIARTKIKNLSVLPLGRTKAHHGTCISPAALRRMINEARLQYDVILIDTGPVLGSLEASLAASQADGVVMVVSRGEHTDAARRAAAHLQAVGARIEGIVFNRATDRDVAGQSYGSTADIYRSSAPPVMPDDAGLDDKTRERFRRLGPLASAVALSSQNLPVVVADQ